MAKDSMMLYLGLGVAALVIFMTDNPIKDAIMKLVPAGDAAGAADATTSTDTGKKHKRGHRRGRHSHANYVEECGY